MAALLTAGCGGAKGATKLLAGLPEPGDAPYQLADDDDLDAERARFDAMPPGTARTELRRRLAAEYAARIANDLDRHSRDKA